MCLLGVGQENVGGKYWVEMVLHTRSAGAYAVNDFVCGDPVWGAKWIDRREDVLRFASANNIPYLAYELFVC